MKLQWKFYAFSLRDALVIVGLTIVALVLLVTAQAVVPTNLNTAQPSMSGLGSWYGSFHQGRRMANGVPFDRNKYTCASRIYPFGTVLLVSFPLKGTFVVVTVTDRGPYRHPDRVIDLSERAAQTLGLKPYGVAYVIIVPVHLRWESD